MGPPGTTARAARRCQPEHFARKGAADERLGLWGQPRRQRQTRAPCRCRYRQLRLPRAPARDGKRRAADEPVGLRPRAHSRRQRQTLAPRRCRNRQLRQPQASARGRKLCGRRAAWMFRGAFLQAEVDPCSTATPLPTAAETSPPAAVTRHGPCGRLEARSSSSRRFCGASQVPILGKFVLP